MHSPRPYGLFIQGDEPTERDQSLIEATVRHLTNIKDTSRVETLRLVRTLPDGGYVIVQDAGGNLRVIVKKSSYAEKFKLDGFAKDFIPILYSGVVTKARLLEGEGLGMKLTRSTRRRMSSYEDSPQTPMDAQLKRFAVAYNPKFIMFKPTNTGIFTFTQYDKQRPTWYSGAMSEVMQIVGGYGKQNYSEENEYLNEPAQLTIPQKYLDDILTELEGVRLPGYSGLPNEEGMFQYDFRFQQCNLISFDSDNKPWLLRIDQQGVYVMPLPVIPATTTAAFREYMEDVVDDEVLKILDRFGAMPSGEGFPEGKDFNTWLRAGVIIKVCDTADFYKNNPFYIACGWSTNSRGTECFNTCWNYNDVNLLQSYAYKLNLDLQPCANQGRLDSTSISADNSQQIGRYLSALFFALEDDTKGLAIRYKIRRVSEDLILARAQNFQGGEIDRNEVDYWDGVIVEPLVVQKGNLSCVYTGPLYWGSKIATSMGRLKFPEISGKGCESFPLVSPDYEGGFVRCDTVVFGCYIDDRLEVIKYFLDDRTYFKEEESNFDGFMTVGQWQKTETEGRTGIAGYFYTTSFDDRQEVPPVTVHTNIVGSDLGYSNPRWQTPGLFWRVGTLSRTRFFKHITKVKRTSGFALDMGVCVPVYIRDAILYGYAETTTGETETEQHSRGGVVDPNSYQFWCHDFIYHYMGVTQSGNLGEPTSKDGVPVYLDSHLYEPNDNTDFADQGEWYGLSSGSFIDVTPICGPYTSRTSPIANVNGVVIGGEEPQIRPFSETKYSAGKSEGRVNACLGGVGSLQVNNHFPESLYWGFSPIPASSGEIYFYRDACRVTFGESKYANISEMNGQQRYRWGHSVLVETHQAHHFLGVINE